jgi:hypothetical protein
MMTQKSLSNSITADIPSSPLFDKRFTVNNMLQSVARLLSFHRLIEGFLEHVSKRPEPRIYRRKNRRGDIYFKVYDPYTDRTRILGSELEVRIWLEARY